MRDDGAHVLNNRLTFSRGVVGSCLYATRMDPIDPNPTTGLAAVPDISGVPGPSLGDPGHTSVSCVSLAPPLPPLSSLPYIWQGPHGLTSISPYPP